MKICIVGAGSIGGYVGVKLAQAGEDVTLIARNANLEAIRSRGMRLTMADGVEHVVRHINASASLAEAGPQDLVILGMKANQLAAVIKDLPHLLHDNTVIVPMQNGIPFWYFQRHGGEFEDRIVHSVDPDGHIMRAIDPSRILGCVVYPACELAAPGWVRHIEGDRFPLGELDGRESERVLAISAMFANAGLKAPVLNNIRSEIWLKLWGNLTFNPISALTHATLEQMLRFELGVGPGGGA